MHQDSHEAAVLAAARRRVDVRSWTFSILCEVPRTRALKSQIVSEPVASAA